MDLRRHTVRMTMMRFVITAAAGLLVLAGCGAEQNNAAVAPTTAAAATTPATSPTPSLSVEEEACTRALRYAEQASDVVSEISKDPSGATLDGEEVIDLAKGMESVAPRLPDEAAIIWDRMMRPIDTLSDVFASGKNDSLDTSAYPEGQGELADICEPYLAS